ncbi:hypothetical protein PsYK624_074410 [Phanerochaete sordida]|uniref:Uncharacterized protein n=1 Tax=Phanerochaete sordida TaxID=48140 RepID=A0A9P3GAY5_9APHY|nr:hypothetical protein PsYK624_074410 [Phanerochaete sordida]
MLSIIPSALVLSGFVVSANAYYPYGYYGDGGMAGGAIAGIVVAVIAAILLVSLCSMMTVRGRRRQPLLPGPNGGFLRINRANDTATVPAVGYDYNNTSAYRTEGPHQPPAGPPPQEAPPPPYPGKEGYLGQPPQNASATDSAATAGAPQPGGFAPPPGLPPAAHVGNDSNPSNNRFGWFKANQ